MREARIAVEEIAKICHVVIKAYCESMGDNSHPEWDNMQPELKQSVINGVEYALKDEYPRSGEALHNNWMAERLKAGWKWGEVKDYVGKEHPSLLPFEHLPQSERSKDLLFQNIVIALSDDERTGKMAKAINEVKQKAEVN